LLLVPFYVSGTGFLFGPLMVALATISAYMLGKRLLSWRVGAIAALLVLTDVSVVMMWYRYYWTDASTMALLVLSIWMAVEANYWMNGRSLEPCNPGKATSRQQLMSLGLAAIAGVAFGASISTRYATALILIPILLYFAAFYLIRAWPMLRKRKMLAAIRSSLRMWPILAGLAIGLICILAPLMAYNSDYFGGPLYSGYDATTLQQFAALGNTTDRNTSTDWMSTSAGDAVSAASNLLIILPVLLIRMPFLILLPVGIWLMRKRIPALILLSTWIAVNFYTYSSISWVSMYATMPQQILYEPRYFIPSVPPIAIFAGLAIERLASKASDWRAGMKPLPRTDWSSRTALIAIAITGVLVLCSLVPVAGFFTHSDQQMNGNPQGGPPDLNGPPNGKDQNRGPPPRAEDLPSWEDGASKIGSYTPV
jgi:hypothetical protein